MSGIKIPFIIDPKTKSESVSLSLLIISFVVLLIACTLHLSKMVDNVSALLELFYGCAGLYFSRKVSFNGKTFDPGSAPTEQQVITTIKETIK